MPNIFTTLTSKFATFGRIGIPSISWIWFWYLFKPTTSSLIHSSNHFFIVLWFRTCKITWNFKFWVLSTIAIIRKRMENFFIYVNSTNTIWSVYPIIDGKYRISCVLFTFFPKWVVFIFKYWYDISWFLF